MGVPRTVTPSVSGECPALSLADKKGPIWGERYGAREDATRLEHNNHHLQGSLTRNKITGGFGQMARLDKFKYKGKKVLLP